MNRKQEIAAGIIAVTILCLFVGFTLWGIVLKSKAEALQFVRGMGAGINLGNTLDATGLWDYKPDADELEYETCWDNPKTDAETFRAMKKAGFGTVRIPVTWEDHLDAEYRISDVWMDRVQEVVDMALEEGLYVILDLHHEEWLDLKIERETEIREEFVIIWEQIAERFQEYDERLLFESMNEPRLRNSEYEWNSGTEELRGMVNKLNEDFVETIRAAGGENKRRYLLVCPYVNTSEMEAMQNMSVPDDNHLIVSVHMYDPYLFCQIEDDNSDWDTEETRERVSNAFQNMNSLFIEQNIPVILTEFGCKDKGNTEARVAWTNYYMTQSKRYGIPCIWWDCEEYTLLDRENKTWKFPEIVEALTGRIP